MQLPGHRVELIERSPSTNGEVRARIAAGEDVLGLVLVAHEQTAGRGRAGRSWHTVPGRSLALTCVHALPALERPSRLTIVAAVAACRALARLGTTDTAIKWPNDLMRGERKIGGLLSEIVRAPTGRELLVLGLGLNLALRPGDLPPEVAARAGDAGLDGRPATRERLVAAFVDELDRALAELGTPADGERGQEYRRRSWLSGRRVALRWGARTESVRIADVSADGDLLLDDGRIAPGEHVQLA